MHKFSPLLLLLILLFCAPSFADFQKGQDAYNRADYETAYKIWKPLAEQGFAKAQFELGNMYYEGQGVAQDYKSALNWFNKAAKQGGFAGAVSQYYLGVMYNLGRGVSKDYTVALNWYKKAAEWGVPNAQYNLAQIYNRGLGVTQDHHAAFKWYKKAAEWDGELMVVDAQYAMGFMYAAGFGVSQDNIRAYMWWDIAAKNGHEVAVSNRDKVKKRMSLSEVSSARFLVRECVAKKYKGC